MPQTSWLRDEPADEIFAARLRAEQFASVVRYTPLFMLANIFNALVMLAAFRDSPRALDAVLWAAAVITIAGYIYIRRLVRSFRELSERRSHSRENAVVYALGLGAAWAALPLFFFQGASHGAQLLIISLSAGMLCGGAFVLASLPAAALAFSAPIAVAAFATLVRTGEKHQLLMAILLVSYALVLFRGAFAYAEQLRRRVLAQLKTEETARARVEKLERSGLHAIGGMASTLAHEVNQPLTAASNYLSAAQRLLDANPATREATGAQQALEKARVEVARVSEIVAGLRDFILGGEPDMNVLHLHALIEEAQRNAAPAADRAAIRLSLRLDAEKDMVVADRVQIGQVCANLIRNAIDALEHEPRREIAISTRTSEDGFIHTQVADTGPGVSEAVRTNLFAPFMTTKPKGMGIGLALARAIVEAHHGRIWAEPVPGGGSKFSFALPLAREGEPLPAGTN